MSETTSRALKGVKIVCVPHNDFGSFGFAGARFAGDDYARVPARPLHGLVGRLRDGKNVRSAFVDFPTLVIIDLKRRIIGGTFAIRKKF